MHESFINMLEIAVYVLLLRRFPQDVYLCTAGLDPADDNLKCFFFKKLVCLNRHFFTKALVLSKAIVFTKIIF